jgi:hypothetical protein
MIMSKEKNVIVRRVLLLVLVAVALYTLAGFFLVPWLAGWIAEDNVREELGRELRIGDIDFNPYTFTLELTDFALADPDGHELFTFDRLFANFTLVSLIDQAWTFQQVRLEGPVVQEERFASGETRFTRLKDDTTGEGGMPAMVIRHLDVVEGAIRFADHLTTATDPSGTTATIVVQEIALSLDDAALHENTGFPVTARHSSAYSEASLDEVRERFTREQDEDPEGRSAFDAVAYRAHLAEEVIAAQPVTDVDLAALGQTRAATVRDRLLADAPDGPEKGIAVEPERVLLSESREVESGNDELVVMEVGLAVD